MHRVVTNMRTTVLGLTLWALGCGGQDALTPEVIGQKAFEYLKADRFTDYYTSLVATPAIVSQTCPGLAGIERYFELGEGSSRPQEDRFIACRQAIDFSQATLVGVTVVPRTQELAAPECVYTILNVDIVGRVRSGGQEYVFTVPGTMQFIRGWRVYKRIKDCGPPPP
jgi:hypothetical protein